MRKTLYKPFFLGLFLVLFGVFLARIQIFLGLGKIWIFVMICRMVGGGEPSMDSLHESSHVDLFFFFFFLALGFFRTSGLESDVKDSDLSS